MTSWYLDEPKMEDCASTPGFKLPHVLLYVKSNIKSKYKHRSKPAAKSPKDLSHKPAQSLKHQHA